ncbi:MAG: hypothetical protein Q9201_002102 [Fulgogasparrea decipioides]
MTSTRCQFETNGQAGLDAVDPSTSAHDYRPRNIVRSDKIPSPEPSKYCSAFRFVSIGLGLEERSFLSDIRHLNCRLDKAVKMPDVFAVPIFFIVFREAVEVSIIVSLLLSFQKQTLGSSGDEKTNKKLRRQVSRPIDNLLLSSSVLILSKVWVGVASGLLVCLIVGGGMIGAFYGLNADHWAATEPYWEGTFSIVASLIIAVMGAALLRISKLQAEWRAKLIKSFEEGDMLKASSWWDRFKAGTRKYFMFWLPFVTVLREGAEAIVFIAGVGLGLPGGSIPLPVIVGLAAGALVGVIIYK